MKKQSYLYEVTISNSQGDKLTHYTIIARDIFEAVRVKPVRPNEVFTEVKLVSKVDIR